MKCPKCGSEHTQKKGYRAGKQRYRCRICGACFTDGVEYVEQIKREQLNLQCPSCKSSHIRRDGIGNGFQRYECRDCGLNFSDYTLKYWKNRPEWKCPYCGGELNYRGYGKKGQRLYYCSKCGKTCSGDKDGKPIYFKKFSEINKDIRCPECKSLNIKKGSSARGHKRYVCNNCGRTFIYDDNVRIYPKVRKKEALKEILSGDDLASVAQKYDYSVGHLQKVMKPQFEKQAIKEVLRGKSIKHVAQKYRFSLKHIEDLLEPVYEKEVINEEQIKDIIKFGVCCNVPVDYMAEYISCSEHKCIEIIEKFKKKHNMI